MKRPLFKPALVMDPFKAELLKVALIFVAGFLVGVISLAIQSMVNKREIIGKVTKPFKEEIAETKVGERIYMRQIDGDLTIVVTEFSKNNK